MRDQDRQTRSQLMNLFSKNGFHPSTNLGQNFLIDLNLVEYIVDQAEIGPADVVLEIGTGTGGMTTFMAQTAAAVVSVEVDPKMYDLASQMLEPYDNVTLLRTDALKNKNNLSPTVIEAVEEKLNEAPNRQLKLVSNLPYNIATPVVSNLVATELPWSLMVVTIQQELGLRMAARAGKNHYGALSVWLQSQCDVKVLKKLRPTVFWPRPKVDSAIVCLIPNEQDRQEIDDRGFFHDFVRRLFHQRRKMMRSVLVGMYSKQLSKPQIDAVLAELEIPEMVRAEDLDIKPLVTLSNHLHSAIEDVELKM